jgi:hypothetical protein
MLPWLVVRCLVVVAWAVAGCYGEIESGAGPDDASVATGDGNPSIVADAAPGAWTPPSKGLWIWTFTYTGLTPAQAATRAHSDGISYVLIKSGQDGSYYSANYNQSVTGEFTSRGIKVFAWPYVTPADIPGAITAIKTAAEVPGTSGIILDVEIEFETDTNGAADATALCDGIRAQAPTGMFLGYTSFGWVGFHGGFPYQAFDQHCGDAFFPQVYWSDRGVDWKTGYDQAISMLASSGLKAPVWIIQSNDDTPSGGAPTTADLNSFFDAAGPYTSLWELPASGESAKLVQLDSLHWRN